MSDTLTGSDSPSADTPDGDIEIKRASLKASLADGVLFNVIVPLVLLSLGIGVIIVLGEVEPKARLADDLTRIGRLRSLPPVRVERLKAIDVEETPLQLEVDGTVVPYREALVAAEVAGQIVFKSDQCEAGDFVTKEQLLMKIDKTDYDLDVERLTKLKEQEYEALTELDQELKNLQRSIEVAKQDVELQQSEVDRQSSLPAGFASRGEIDQAKRVLLQSTQQLVGYENQVDLLKKRRVRLEASERLAATQLKAAEVNLQRCEIRAPIDGVIVTENADLNTFVARGSTLVTIEDTSRVEVATNLRMDQLYWVLDQDDQSGTTGPTVAGGYRLPATPAIIEFELSGLEQAFYRWEGELRGYNGIGLDATSRTVPVRVVVDNPRRFKNSAGAEVNSKGPSALVRGMYVTVKLLIKPQTPLVVIPARALKPGNRVWQFIPDESVLDAPPEQENEPEVTAGEDQEQGVASDEMPFDPNQWAPGRIVVRRSIIPVDSLHTQQNRAADRPPAGSETGDGEDGRLWVCEVRDQSLSGGSLVVTSPLASVDNDNMPARANADAVTGTANDNVAVRQTIVSKRMEEQ